MAFLMADNKLHFEYWRQRTASISFTQGAAATGHNFENAFDNNPATTFKMSGASQPIIVFQFNSLKNINAVGLSNVNLSNAALNISTSADGVTYNSLFTFNSLSTSTLKIAASIVSAKYIAFEFFSATSSNYIGDISIGYATSKHIKFQAPYTPALFAPLENKAKRNNNGRALITDTQEKPQDLKLTISNLKESDFTGKYMYETDNNPWWTELSKNLVQYPFYVSTADVTTVEANDAAYYCVLKDGLKQPRFTSPGFLELSIDCLGYYK